MITADTWIQPYFWKGEISLFGEIKARVPILFNQYIRFP